MRKTKACSASKVENVVRLVMRTCWRERKHDGPHHDKHGSWSDPTHVAAKEASDAVSAG